MKRTIKNTIRKTLAAAILFTAPFNAVSVEAQETPEVNTREVPLYITVEIGNTQVGAVTPRTPGAGDLLTTVPGEPLKIKGIAMPAADRNLQITITPPQSPKMPDPSEAAGDLPEGEKTKTGCAGWR